MNNRIPKITVVTVVYNGIKVLKDTIVSVVEQDYSALEYIIIDGASTDGTLDIIKQFDKQISIWVSEPDKGVYDAMNKGIEKATGEWIIFMNAGDFFYSKSSISEMMANHQDFDKNAVIYGDAQFRLKNIAYINEAHDRVSSEQFMPFSHQAAFTRTSVAKQTKFDLNYRIAADTAFFLQLTKEGHLMQRVPVIVCSYNALEGLSADNEVKRCKEIVALQAKWNGINPKDNYFKKYIKNARIKQFIRKLTPPFLWIRFREKSVYKKHKQISKIG